MIIIYLFLVLSCTLFGLMYLAFYPPPPSNEEMMMYPIKNCIIVFFLCKRKRNVERIRAAPTNTTHVPRKKKRVCAAGVGVLRDISRGTLLSAHRKSHAATKRVHGAPKPSPGSPGIFGDVFDPFPTGLGGYRRANLFTQRSAWPELHCGCRCSSPIK